MEPLIFNSLDNRIAVKSGIFIGDLDNLDALSLAGTRCSDCSETSIGTNALCPCCGSQAVTSVALSRNGPLWSYTVARNRPPGAYKGPDPFVPFGIGLIELSEAVRVMAPLAVPLEELRVGMPVALSCFVQHRDDQGREVIAFNFRKFEEA